MTTPTDTNRPPTGRRGWLLLALLWLFHALASLLWLWQDERFPFAEQAVHLANALRLAETLTLPADGQPALLYLFSMSLVWLGARSADALAAINLLWLGLLLIAVYGLGRRLLPGGWPALAAAGLFSFFPLTFTHSRIYDPALALAALVSLTIWFLALSDGLSRRRYALLAGLAAATGALAGGLYWTFVLLPGLLATVQALLAPRPPRIRRREPSRNRIEWLNRRLRLAPAHWNALAAWLLALFPYFLRLLLTGLDLSQTAAASAPSLLWRLSRLDDAMGGFMLLLLVIGVGYAFFRLLRPARPGDRWHFGLILAWLAGGLLLGSLSSGDSTGLAVYLLPLLPAAALLIVAGPADLARPGPGHRPLRLAGYGLAGLASLVLLVNFVIISWGAPPALAAALKVSSPESSRPLGPAIDAPLWAPGRAIIQQYPPRTEDWAVEAIVARIAEDCPAGQFCNVIVLPCYPNYERRSFLYQVVQEGLADRLNISGIGQDADFYYRALDAHYLVGKTGQQACSLATPTGRNLEIMRPVITDALFTERFKTLASFGLPEAGANGWVLRRTGPPLAELPQDQRLSLLEHVLTITPNSSQASIALSQVLIDLGDPARAIQVRRDAVQRAPDNVAARLALANLYLENTLFVQAVEQYQAVLDLNPERASTLLNVNLGLARAYANLGQWEEAEAAYRRAVAAAPDDYNALVAQGRFYVERGRFADATEALLIARRLQPGRPEAYLALADAHLLRNDQARAQELFQQARELDMASVDPLLSWAASLLKRGQIDEALALYAEAAGLDQENIVVYVLWIDALRQAGRYELALSLAESLIETFPDSAEAHKALGHVLRQLERSEEAAQQYRQALAMAPEDYRLRLTLSDLLVQMERYDDALAVLEAGLDQPARHAELYTAMGDLANARADTAAAIIAYQDALTANPFHWEAANKLGRLYLRAEQPDQALKVANNIVDRRSDVYQVWLLQGDAYQALGRQENALAAYRSALSLAPDIAFLHVRLGNALLRVRNFAAAEASFRQALALDPRLADAQVGLGRVALTLGVEAGESVDQFRFVQAEQAFGAALEIDSESLNARIGLGDLYAAYGLPDQAILYFEDVLNRDPSQAEVRNRLYLAYLQANRSAEGLAFFRQLLRDNPQDVNALRAVVEASAAGGRLDDALAAIDSFLAQNVDQVEALELKAETLRQAGRLEAAVAAFQDVSRAAPQSASPHWKEGDVLVSLDRLDEAEAAYRTAIQLIEASGPAGAFANRYLAYTGLARLLLRQGRSAEALETAQTINRLRPELAQVYILMGDIYRAMGRRVEAQSAYRQALDRDSANALALSRLGDSLLEGGQLETAQRLYEEALAVDEQQTEALIGLARVISRRSGSTPSQLEQAADNLQTALIQNPDNAAVHLVLGDLLMAQDEPAAAAAEYQAVLLLQPDHPTAFFSLGQALLAAGDVEQALQTYQAAVAAAPDADIRQNRRLALAATYRSLNRLDEAEQIYLALLADAPGNAAAQIALGDLYLQMERPDEAILRYRNVYQADPANAQAAAQLGKAYLQAGDLAGAAEIAGRILQSQPDSHQAHILAALVATAQGDSAAALEAYQQAAVLAPGNASVQVQLGNAFLLAGRLGDAAAAYSAALALDQRYLDAFVGLGRAYLRQNALADAEQVLRQALTIDPVNLAAAATLGGLLIDSDRADEAIPLLQSVLAQRPDHPTAGLDLASAYLAVGRLDEGLALYEALLDPADDARDLVVAKALLDAGQTDRALDYYRRFVADHPDDSQALLALGDAYRQLGDPDQALSAYQSISQADHRFVDAAIRQGDLLGELERWPEAAAAYEAAVASLSQTFPPLPLGEGRGEGLGEGRGEGRGEGLGEGRGEGLGEGADRAGSQWQAWIGLARAYARLGRSDEALDALQDLASLRPDLYQPWLLTGDIYRDAGRSGDALAAYQQAASLAPDLGLAWTRQGDIFLRLDDARQAESAYEKALALDASDAAALEGLGRVYALYGAGASPVDFYRAEAQLKQAIELGGSTGAYVALGDLYTAYGVPEEAIGRYRAALEIRPDHPTARSKLAAALLAAGQPEEALAEQLRRAAEAPDDVGGLIALAEIYRVLARYDDAEASYRQALALQPNDPGLTVALGDLFMERGQVEQAIPTYSSAAGLAEARGDMRILAQARSQLGKALLRLNRVQEALALAQRMVREQPDQQAGHLLLGDIYLAQADWPAAEAAYNAGVDQVADAKTLRLRLGDVYLRQGQFEEAQALFQEMVDEQPRDVAAYVGLARAHMAQAGDLSTLRFEWANDALRSALRVDPRSVPALTAMGDLMLANDRPNQAVRSYQEALAARTSMADDTAVRSKLAAAYAANGQTDLALQEYQRVAVANPTDLGIQMALGNGYLAVGRLDQALAQYRKVTQVDPSFPFAYLRQGELLDEMGRWDEALAAYRAAVAVAPDNADAWFTLASAYRKRSLTAEAIAALEAGLALDPGREAARRSLVELQAVGG